MTIVRQVLIEIIFIVCLCCLTRQVFADGESRLQKRATLSSRARAGAADNQGRGIALRPGNISVERQLTKIVDLSALKFQTTFSQAIDILRNSTEPPLNIAVLWRDLSENTSVDRDTPIYIEGISKIPLSMGLELVLRSVSSRQAELGYVIDGGVIIIATKDSLPVKKVIRVYDISDLVAPPAGYGFIMPVTPFWPAPFGFGGGWMGQGGARGLNGAWRAGRR